MQTIDSSIVSTIDAHPYMPSLDAKRFSDVKHEFLFLYFIIKLLNERFGCSSDAGPRDITVSRLLKVFIEVYIEWVHLESSCSCQKAFELAARVVNSSVAPMSQRYAHATYYAIAGGIFSAIGSALGKLPGLFDSWILVGLGFLMMATVNSIGFMMFAKSLHESSTSLRPTLLSTASSYFTSALLGLMVFTEETSLTWWTGTFLILAGILAISSEKTKTD